MSNLNSYNILINRFKAFADGHFLLKNFTYGAITLADLQKFGLYPFMHIVPVDVSYETGVKNFSFDVFFADLPREEENKAEYQKETLSDLQQIAEDLLGEITNHRVIFGKDVSVISSRLVPFEEEFSNVLTGWNLSISLQIPYNWSACDIPASFNDYIVYNQNTGESSILEFKDSIVREGGEVRLVNDLEFPPASYYYGTDSSGERGWFIFPTDEVGLTCETLGACDTIIDIETNITNLENDVEDLSANVVQVQTDLTTLEESLSAVATSGDYNDLINQPTIPDSTSDLINDSGFITINDVPTFVSVVAHEVKLGSTMTKGTPVYVSSADGTNMVVSPASNTSEATSSKTLGLLMEGGNNNAKVQVITEGLLDGLNTSTATIGDAVWLGSTGTLIYGLANKPVAPLHLVFIGIVTRVNTNNGEIFVKVQNGFELEEIHNVLIQSVANNEGLFYESATSLWKNKSIQQIISSLNGILIPQMTTTQRNAIISPTIGLQIFNTTEGYIEFYDSFWGWMPIANQNEWKRKWGMEYFNDFGSNNAFTGDGVFQTFPVSGGGFMSFAPIPSGSSLSWNYLGILGLATGVNPSGQNAIRTDLNTGAFFRPSFRISLTSRLWLQTLSDISNRYNVIFGLSQGANSTIANGCVFIYDEGGVGIGTTASPNWQIITATSSVRTNFVTSVVVSPLTWYSFRIESNSTFTELYYYINDVLVRTETTNIPTSITNVPIVSISKNSGITNRAVAVDYLGLKVKLNSAR